MTDTQLHGSGGWVIADITDEQAKNADLGVGKLFLSKVEKLDTEKSPNIIVKIVILSLMNQQELGLRSKIMRKYLTN